MCRAAVLARSVVKVIPRSHRDRWDPKSSFQCIMSCAMELFPILSLSTLQFINVIRSDGLCT